MKRRKLLLLIGGISGVGLSTNIFTKSTIAANIQIENSPSIIETWSEPEVKLNFSKFTINTKNLDDSDTVDITLKSRFREDSDLVVCDYVDDIRISNVNENSMSPLILSLNENGGVNFVDKMSEITNNNESEINMVIELSIEHADLEPVRIKKEININVVEQTTINGIAIEDWYGGNILEGPKFNNIPYSETEPENSDYKVNNRPKWTNEGGSVSFNNSIITVVNPSIFCADIDSSITDNQTISSYTSRIRWKANNPTGNTAHFIFISSGNTQDNISGYSITPRSGAGEDIEIFRWDNGSPTNIIEYDNKWNRDSNWHTFKFSADSNNNYTTVFDGNTLGTLKDDTYSGLTKFGLIGGNTSIDWWEVY